MHTECLYCDVWHLLYFWQLCERAHETCLDRLPYLRGHPTARSYYTSLLCPVLFIANKSTQAVSEVFITSPLLPILQIYHHNRCNYFFLIIKMHRWLRVVSRLLSWSGLWLQPETRVVVFGGGKELNVLFQHSTLRNTLHVLYITYHLLTPYNGRKTKENLNSKQISEVHFYLLSQISLNFYLSILTSLFIIIPRMII